MKHILFVVLFVCMSAVPLQALFAQLSGGTYEIYADTFSFISTGETSGGAYTLFSTGGEFFATSTSGGDYTLRAGFRAVEKGILRFDLTTSSIDFGIVTTTAISSASTAVIVETDSATGYSLAVRQTDDFASGADSINPVGDGTVTLGEEEYGISVSGPDALVGTDIGLSLVPTNIARAGGLVTGNRTDIVFKMSVSPATPPGAYSHTVRFLATINP